MGMAEESPLKTVVFRCKACKSTFEAEPARVEEAPADDDVHAWRYFHPCACGEEASQAPWQRAAMKAWRCATGPKTPEGKAAVRENLRGHPTPEEALRTRFNGMKHGLNARTATTSLPSRTAMRFAPVARSTASGAGSSRAARSRPDCS